MGNFFKAVTEIGILLLIVALLYYLTSGFGSFNPSNLADRATNFIDGAKDYFTR